MFTPKKPLAIQEMQLKQQLMSATARKSKGVLKRLSSTRDFSFLPEKSDYPPFRERFMIERKPPVVDIQVLANKNLVPKGFKLLSHAFGGRSANLNKGTTGQPVYIC